MINVVLFDLGNTLFEFRDFSLPAYAGRLRRAFGPIAERLREKELIGDDTDLDALSGAVFNRIAAVEERTRRDSSEYDAATEIREALAESLTGVNQDWDDFINLSIYAVMSAEFELRIDAIAVMEALRERCVRTGLISNTQFRAADHIRDLERMGLAPLLDVMIFSSELGARKPVAAVFEKALETLNVKPEETLMVGDTVEADIEGPRRLGMRTALIRTPVNAGRIESDDHGADVVIESLSEVPGIIARWSRQEL